MCQKEFPKGERAMQVAEARMLHQGLLSKLMNGPGDSEGAMHKAERAYGLPYWCQFNLRHKGRASLQFMLQLRGAYSAALEASVRRDLEYLKTEQAKEAADALDASLMAEAESLLAKIQERKAVK